MNNTQYWTERALLQEQRSRDQSDKLLSNLKKEYAAAQKNLQEQIDTWYKKYGEENKISPAQARKKLTAAQQRQHNRDIEDFIAKAKTGDPKYEKELRQRYIASRVSRLQSLQDQTVLQLELLGKSQDVKTYKLLQEIYKDTYYHGLYNASAKTGLHGRFDRLSTEAVEQICKTPWSNKSFSERIWSNNDKLIKEVRSILSQGAMRGTSIDRMSRQLAKRMEVDYHRAECLIRTESAFIREQAAADAYKQMGVKRYQYLATLDRRTSLICRSLDNQVFAVNEKAAGVNYPPMHPRCRSTTIPYYEDEFTAGETRAARTSTGERMQIPAAMSYDEWYEKYIKNEAGYKIKQNRGVKLSQEAIQAYIVSEITKLPATHQQWVQGNLEMVYVSAAENSGYLGNGAIRLNEALIGEQGVLVHEIGHMINDQFSLLNNERFLTILDDVFGDFSPSMMRIDSTHYVESILLYFNPRVDNRFVSEYQRRIYMEEGLFNETGVNYNCFKDYIAEGYAFYIREPDVLKAKDQNLFEFIEGLI